MQMYVYTYTDTYNILYSRWIEPIEHFESICMLLRRHTWRAVLACFDFYRKIANERHLLNQFRWELWYFQKALAAKSLEDSSKLELGLPTQINENLLQYCKKKLHANLNFQEVADIGFIDKNVSTSRQIRQNVESTKLNICLWCIASDSHLFCTIVLFQAPATKRSIRIWSVPFAIFSTVCTSWRQTCQTSNTLFWSWSVKLVSSTRLAWAVKGSASVQSMQLPSRKM